MPDFIEIGLERLLNVPSWDEVATRIVAQERRNPRMDDDLDLDDRLLSESEELAEAEWLGLRKR